MKRHLYAAMIAAFALGVGAFVGAQEAESGTASAKTFSLKLGGDHEFLYAIPVGDPSWGTGYDGEMKTPRFRNEVGIEVKEGELALVSHWQLDSFLKLGGSPTDQWSDSTRARNLENYIAWNPEAFRLAFGYQVFTWGVADGRNPTDNINPRDYSTMEGNKGHKIPVLSAGVNWYPAEEISVEAVFVPQAVNSITPIDYLSSLNATGFNATYASVDNKPGDFIGGGKLNYRSTAVDLSLSYLYDLDQQYTPVIGNASFTPGLTDVSLERKRVQRIGADAKTTLDRFGIWAEACYTLTGNSDGSDYSTRLSRLDYTLGFDFSYGPGDNCYLNLQYTGTVIPGFDSSKNTESTPKAYYEKMLVASMGGEREGITQGVTWNAHWNLLDSKLVPTFTGAYSMPFNYDDSSATRYGNLLLKPEIDIMPVDSFHITAGAILSYAWIKESGKSVALDTTQDSLGIYSPYNHLFLSVSYKWNYELSK
jgi:hypothetical protein